MLNHATRGPTLETPKMGHTLEDDAFSGFPIGPYQSHHRSPYVSVSVAYGLYTVGYSQGLIC